MLKNGNLGIGTTAPTAPTMGLHQINVNGILAEGTFGSGNTVSSTGAGTRMVWYPRKAAFRAGRVTALQWDDSNIGNYSVSFGLNNTAMGAHTTAIGNETQAVGTNSFAAGYQTIATGSYATAYMGSVSANIGSENAYFFAGMGAYKGNIDNEFHNYIAPKHPTYFILGLKHQPYNSNLYFKIFMMPHWAEYKDMIWDYPLTYAHKRTMSCRVGVSLGYAFNTVSKSKLVLATNPIQKRYKNAVFLQLLGDSYLGGIGYSRILLDRKSFFWDIRGILTPSFNLFPTSWIGSSLNFGKNKHYLETGVSYNWWANSESYRHENQMNMINSITPVVGYKLLTNHFFLRASFTPMISNDFYKKIMPWGGVSIGGTF